jgi:hypothetical protein
MGNVPVPIEVLDFEKSIWRKIMKERIYLVTGPTGEVLIKAPSRNTAIASVANVQYTASVATQDELVDMITKGHLVINARPDTQELDFGDE